MMSKADEEFNKSEKVSDPMSTDNAGFQIVLGIILNGLKSDPMKYHEMKERLDGVSEETTTGVKRLYQMQQNGTLLFPAINVMTLLQKARCPTSYLPMHLVLHFFMPKDGYKTSDTLTSASIYGFLKKWLTNHLKFLHNPLYVYGLSYSGITVPIIVHDLFSGNEAGNVPKLNIKVNNTPKDSQLDLWFICHTHCDFEHVAIKALIVIHRTLREGDPTLREELLHYSHMGQILQIYSF